MPRKEQAVTCDDIDDLITSGAEDLLQAPAALEHLALCPGCRFLVRALEEIERGGPVGAPTADLLSAIESAITAKLRPVRPLAPAGVFLFASIVIFVGVVTVATIASGTNGWTALRVAERIAVLAAAAGGAVPVAVSMIGQMTPGSKRVADPAGLLFAILMALLLVIAVAFRPNPEVDFIANGLACMKRGFTVSLAASLLLWLLLRRGAACSPKLFGAAAGGLAGLAGLSVLDLTCPNVNVFHILAWHWSEVLISASAGALFCAAIESHRRTKRNCQV
jgi:hypothetical protein